MILNKFFQYIGDVIDMSNIYDLNALLYLCQDEKNGILLAKLFKMYYLAELYHYKKTGLEPGQKFIVEEICPLPKRIWDSITSGKFQSKYSKKIEIITRGSNEHITINNIHKTSVIARSRADITKFKEHWLEVLNTVKFIYKDSPVSRIDEKPLLGVAPWKQAIYKGFLGKELSYSSIEVEKNG